jgi:hypothetical protein
VTLEGKRHAGVVSPNARAGMALAGDWTGIESESSQFGNRCSPPETTRRYGEIFCFVVNVSLEENIQAPRRHSEAT